MRIPIDSAVGEAAPPPPYTAYEADPAVSPEYAPPDPAEANSVPVRTSLRGGYTRSISSGEPDTPNLSSAAAYFEERRFQRDYAAPDLDMLEHNIHFDVGFTPTRLPFPHPSDSYLSRDITGQDWATFVNYLFPIQDERRDKKSRSGSDEKRLDTDHLASPEKRERIEAVIAEWNAGFFSPRLIRVNAHFEPPSIGRFPTTTETQRSPHANEESRDVSQYPATVNPGRPAPEYTVPPTSLAGGSQAGPSNLQTPRHLHHSASLASISSSSSSSSASSVDSISSKDLDHATIPEIHAIISAFRADPNKKYHLRKSVKELRYQLRTQHLPFSATDPYNSKASKDEKKAFKEQRKTLRKDLKAIIKEAKVERNVERKSRKAARRIRRDARRQERREMKHLRRDSKRAQKDLERNYDRELQRGINMSKRDAYRIAGLSNRKSQSSQDHAHREAEQNSTNAFAESQNSAQGIAGIPQARAAHGRTTSWGSDRVAYGKQKAQSAAQAAQERVMAVRTRSNEAVEAARMTAEAARESARQVGQRAQDTALNASRAASNTAANAAARAQETAQGATRRISIQAAAQLRPNAAGACLANRDWEAEGKERARVAE